MSQVLPVAQQQKKEPPLEEILRHLFAQETETVGRELRVVHSDTDHSINTQNGSSYTQDADQMPA